VKVKAIAARLALRFQARKFDNTAAGEEDTPFLELERFCEQLPICRTTPPRGSSSLRRSTGRPAALDEGHFRVLAGTRLAQLRRVVRRAGRPR